MAYFDQFIEAGVLSNHIQSVYKHTRIYRSFQKTKQEHILKTYANSRLCVIALDSNINTGEQLAHCKDQM